MLKKVDAENNKLSIWSKEDFDKALAYEVSAIQKIKEKNYSEAESDYKKAIKQIDDTLLKKEDFFNKIILDAITNLNEGNLEQSEIAFNKAKAIHEEDQRVIRGLERIKSRDEVMVLYNNSLEQEKNNFLDEAILSLDKAIKIEPELKLINKKQAEIKEKKLEFDFNNTVSQVLEAFDNYDLALVKTKIKYLKSLNANDPIIDELELRFNEEKKSLNIKQLQIRARKQESNEQWENAKNSYQKILNIDSNSSTAIVGKERVKKYSHLNELIDDIVNKPERLQDDKVFEKSKKALNFVKNEIKEKQNIYYSTSKTPKLNNKITLAEKNIEKASTLIKVTILSDTKTDVSMYKVAQFGKISEKKIQLRPGKYTIVGTRAGYRDFRKTIQITANDQGYLVNVQCRERI
ncbi:MAG: hypothetical protein OQL19_17985 [Gammaproteobacteria bacterium]|nr:hypothetical protein [Gammaproteobacteria bacterium]